MMESKLGVARDALVLRILDDRYALSRHGAHASGVSTMAEVNAALDDLIALASGRVAAVSALHVKEKSCCG